MNWIDLNCHWPELICFSFSPFFLLLLFLIIENVSICFSPINKLMLFSATTICKTQDHGCKDFLHWWGRGGQYTLRGGWWGLELNSMPKRIVKRIYISTWENHSTEKKFYEKEILRNFGPEKILDQWKWRIFIIINHEAYFIADMWNS